MVLSRFSIKNFGLSVDISSNILVYTFGTRLKLVDGRTQKVTDSVNDIAPCTPSDFLITKDQKVLISAISPGLGGRRIVILIDQTGNRITEYEKDSNNKALFTSPYKLTSTSNGTICVVDKLDWDFRGREVVICLAGTIKGIYTGHPDINIEDKPFTPLDILATPSDNILVANWKISVVHILNSDGDFISYYCVYEIGIQYPHSFVLSTSGTLSNYRAKLYKNLAENEGMIPEKYGNLELMKIPNFLHLTPLHIKKQKVKKKKDPNQKLKTLPMDFQIKTTSCVALTNRTLFIVELCTPWPEVLEGQEMNRLFPLEFETNDHCFASNNIRDPRARNDTVKVITLAILEFDVAHLKLTKAAIRKFLHLVGDRYDDVNNEVTLTSDRCPLKAHNFDYIMYLITVLYHESLVKEPWEDEITLEDMSRAPWKYSSSRKNLVKMLAATNNINIKDENLTEEDQEQLKQLDSEIDEEYKTYKSTVLNLVNAGETEKNIENYKNSVLELMNLPKFEVH